MGRHLSWFRIRYAFLKQFAKNPSSIGAITPSSRGLARQMVDWIDWGNIKVVVEYGPGTGVFTKEIIGKISNGTTYFGLETDPIMVDFLARNYPDACIYKDSAANVRKYLAKHNFDKADVIISGLPWAAFPKTRQNILLSETLAVLKEGGYFATFAYLQGLLLPAGLRFRKALKSSFSLVQCSRVIWLNLPPAIVYQCKK